MHVLVKVLYVPPLPVSYWRCWCMTLFRAKVHVVHTNAHAGRPVACSRLSDTGGRRTRLSEQKNERGLGVAVRPKPPSIFHLAMLVLSRPVYYLNAWNRLTDPKVDVFQRLSPFANVITCTLGKKCIEGYWATVPVTCMKSWNIWKANPNCLPW